MSGARRRTSTALVVPEPRTPIKPGWLEQQFVPAAMAVTDYSVFDEIERRVNMLLAAVEGDDGDEAAVRAALTTIAARRGQLLGPLQQGRALLNPGLEADASHVTQIKWRKLGEHWDELWPKIVAAVRNKKPGLTTQAYCLGLLDVQELRERVRRAGFDWDAEVGPPPGRRADGPSQDAPLSVEEADEMLAVDSQVDEPVTPRNAQRDTLWPELLQLVKLLKAVERDAVFLTGDDFGLLNEAQDVLVQIIKQYVARNAQRPPEGGRDAGVEHPLPDRRGKGGRPRS